MKFPAKMCAAFCVLTLVSALSHFPAFAVAESNVTKDGATANVTEGNTERNMVVNVNITKLESDIVIYGGISGAITAAIQARNMDKSVVIVSPDKHLGGMTTGGLGFTDSGKTATIGGLSREFYRRVYREYQKPETWKWEKRDQYANVGQGTKSIRDEDGTAWTFEPGVAERVYEQWLAEHDIPVFREEKLDRSPGGVRKEGTRLVSFKTLSGKEFSGLVFLDTTYEGDLMAAAGVSYTVGREPNAQYGETWNGVQKSARHHGHYFEMKISPYDIPGDPKSGVLPFIQTDPPGEDGQGDRRLQAYCFRMCLTTHPENRVAFGKPEGYDPGRYELLRRVLATGWREVFHKFDRIPNRKTDTNNHGPFSTDFIGMNYDYPEASYERRAEIVEEHRRYQQGLMYFLANDPGVPEDVSREFRKWGYAEDEFTDNDHWPHQIYVREGRRMIGEYVTCQQDCLAERMPPRPVGMGSYVLDSHNVQRYITPEGYVQNEGDVGVPPKGAYGIDFGSLLPKKEQCTNLLVPTCVSSSHIAYGSIRMEPVFMILGQSAATAAAMALDDSCPVQDVSYEKLSKRLLRDGQVLSNASMKPL